MSDLENSTAFTADEIREYYRAFIKDCPGGSLTMTLDDLISVYAKIFPEGDASKFAVHIFNQFDADHSGRIDFREFLSALSIQLKGTLEEKLEWAFNLYDLDGTGFIERNELVEIARTMHAQKGHVLELDEKASPQQIADYIMQRADTDKDNKLSKKEFVDAVVASKTIRKLVLGTLEATGSPFCKRKSVQHH
jgi:Ca2+-binding EF-hand superfamily protein